MANILVHFPAVGVVTPIVPTTKLESSTVQVANPTGSGASLLPAGSSSSGGNITPPPGSHSVLAGPRVVTRVDQLHWIDPVLANALMQQFSASDPVSKDQLGDTQIARSEPVDADTLFQSPKDPSKYFYLPHFEIRRDQQHIAVHFTAAPGSTGWRLDVKVAELTPPLPQLPPLANLNRFDPAPATRVYLSYNTPYGTTPNRDFQSFTPETVENVAGYHLTMNLDSVGLRDEIFFAMTTPASKCQIVVVRQPKIAVPDVDSLYRIETPATLATIAFWYPFELHHGPDDIYTFTPGVVGGESAPQIHRVTYLGTPYVYFQDPSDASQFYYLPDSFKLCRRDSSPHYPCLSIGVSGDTLERARATVWYVALPVIDQGRLDAAQNADELKTWATGPIRVDPLSAQSAVLSLCLPGEGEAGPYSVRTQAHVNLNTGIYDSFAKSLVECRNLFDSLFEQASPLFKGYVTVTVAQTSYEIPFAARIGDLIGPVFDQQTALKDTNTIAVTLRNAIEGSIELLEQPAACVVTNKGSIACEVRSPLTFPVALKAADDGRLPADELRLTLSASTQLADGQYQVVMQTNHRVTSTAQAVLAAVLAPDVQSHFTRTVTVRVPSGVFGEHGPQPGPQLVAVQVDFEHDTSATFEAPESTPAPLILTQTVTIGRSIVDYLLSATDDGSYRYRITRIYSDGHRVQDADWRTDMTPTLFPDLAAPAHG